MKILFITGSLNQGGAEYQILQLAKLFQEKEHEVEVFAITDYNFYKPIIEEYKLKYDHLFNHQSKFRRVLLTSKKLRKLILRSLYLTLKCQARLPYLQK